MMQRLLLSLLLILSVLTSGWSDNDAPYYHKVSVESGDGVLSLLRRYKLASHECNIARFYELNKLKPGDALKTHLEYAIPVLIYNYNGISIRSSIGSDDWDKAIRIKEFNETILRAGLRRSHYRKSKILWVPYNEIRCTDLPMSSDTELNGAVKLNEIEKQEDKVTGVPDANTIIYPLFGTANEVVKIKSKKLEGKVFYVVAGHGGPDPGAVAEGVSGRYTLCEDEYAYDVSLRLVRELMSQGAQVHMIIEDKNDGIRDAAFLNCDHDETCNNKTIPLNQIQRLKQRTDRINELYAINKRKGLKDHKVICIHVDSRAAHKRQDVFFYYYGKSRKGKKLANNLHKTFKAKYQKYQASRGYHGTLTARPLYLLRNTNPSAVYVELANIRNSTDRKRLLQEENREALAKWLAEGLAK